MTRVVEWSVDRLPAEATILEHRSHGETHHRKNAGGDIGRDLGREGGWAEFEVEFDQDPLTRDSYQLCLYSTDWVIRNSDRLRVNGEIYPVVHRRYMASDGGRKLVALTPAWYETPALTCYSLPDESIIGGRNRFALELKGGLRVHAVFISSLPRWTPGPDPDPDPDPPACGDSCPA